eukprot:241198-Amphidinium_carterae.2
MEWPVIYGTIAMPLSLHQPLTALSCNDFLGSKGSLKGNIHTQSRGVTSGTVFFMCVLNDE